MNFRENTLRKRQYGPKSAHQHLGVNYTQKRFSLVTEKSFLKKRIRAFRGKWTLVVRLIRFAKWNKGAFVNWINASPHNGRVFSTFAARRRKLCFVLWSESGVKNILKSLSFSWWQRVDDVRHRAVVSYHRGKNAGFQKRSVLFA